MKKSMSSLFSVFALLVSVNSAEAAVPAEYALIFNNQGVEAIQAEKWSLAIEKLTMANLIDPTYALARSNLGTVHNNYGLILRDSDPPKALMHFRQAVYYSPDFVTRTNLKGMTRQTGKNFDSFAEHIQFANEAKRNNDLIGSVVEYRLALAIKKDLLTNRKLRVTELLLRKKTECEKNKLQVLTDKKLAEEMTISDRLNVALLMQSNNKWLYARKILINCLQSSPDSAAKSPTDRKELLVALMRCENMLGDLDALQRLRKEYVQSFPNDDATKVTLEEYYYFRKDLAAMLRAETESADLKARRRMSLPLRIYLFSMTSSKTYSDATLLRYTSLAMKAFTEWSPCIGGQASLAYVSEKKNADVICRWTTDLEERRHSFSAGETFVTGPLDGRAATAKILLFLDRKSVWTDSFFYGVCLHEIGHALGLEHSALPEDVMYAGDVAPKNVRHLSKNDIGRMKALYHNVPAESNRN